VSFVSLEFVVFFAAVIAGMALMPSTASRQAYLLVMSVVFYALGTPWFIVVLAVPSLVDYACALRIQSAADSRERRSWLTLSLVTNLGILFYFKYANFFVDNVAGLFGMAPHKLSVVLPIGISFFTFKTISYTIDVYRGVMPACRSLWRYAMFVSFFPELVAGPIVRASVFLPQLDRPLQLSWNRTRVGVQMVLLGLTKKLLIADRLAVFVDPVFASPGVFSGFTVASAVIAYSIQIYCDFSGYTDMALGLAKVIGFDLPENFNMPYAAQSITEFWRRWHITLSEWLRDYLYIPLGGSRRGRRRTYINLVATMLLGGLWHGASWTFVAWGAWHGLGLAVHKWWLTRRGARTESRATMSSRASAWLLTYTFVCGGWILFRAPTLPTAWLIARKVAGAVPGGVVWVFLPLVMLSSFVLVGHGIGRRFYAVNPRSSSATTHTTAAQATAEFFPHSPFVGALVLTSWLIVIYLFTPLHRSPFIYFRF
jgi:alginate O-acetyltransferase complex protein AlgI